MQPANRDVTFLIVDDDEIDVRALRRGLAKNRIANPVHVAADGVEALAMLRGEGGQPKLPRPYLVLLDLNMPRMGGLEFLAVVRDDPELTDSIIFVLTTSSDDEDKVSAYRQHVAGYLLKSEADESFLRVIQMIDKFVVTVQFPPPA